MYQQFWIVDPDYARFMDVLRYNQPTESQLDEFKKDVLCQPDFLQDQEICQAFNNRKDTSIMTVS